ncbi:hypothetical protein KEM56_006067 [Ascosphaera pollenicola]|nr:hypothetical protein KEM56_006067 [Ascosphaera pollenicola]
MGLASKTAAAQWPRPPQPSASPYQQPPYGYPPASSPMPPQQPPYYGGGPPPGRSPGPPPGGPPPFSNGPGPTPGIPPYPTGSPSQSWQPRPPYQPGASAPPGPPPGSYGYPPQQWNQPPQPREPYGQYGYGQQQQQQQPPYPSYSPQFAQPAPLQRGQPPIPPKPYGTPGGPPSGPPGGPPMGGPPPGRPPYGGQGPPGAPSPAELQAYRSLIIGAIQENGLQKIYPPGHPAIEGIVNAAPPKIRQVCEEWRIPKEIAQDIVKLALYDIVIFIDDSGSMSFEEGGERLQDLQLILGRVAFAASLFDDDGIQVRFMNSDQRADGLRTEQQAQQLVSTHRFRGLTPLGTNLKSKVIDDLVLPKLRSGNLRKPVLIVTITDGEPTGENRSTVGDVILSTVREAEKSPYGKGAVAFQIAQVGNDLRARRFLSELDEDPRFGRSVDCISNYENEADEMLKLNPPVDLTPDLWLVKLMLGAIDASYDEKDEQSSGPPPSGRPPGGPPSGPPGGPPPGMAPGQGPYGYGGGPPGGPPPQGGPGGPPAGPPPGQRSMGGGYGYGYQPYGAPGY